MDNENKLDDIPLLDSEDLNNKLHKIIDSITLLDNTIDKIKNKISDINKVYMRFEFNKSLSLKKTNSYLKFQADLLNNEKKYYKNVKKIIIEKLSNEMYEIAEYSLLILVSLEDIDIENEEKKRQILSKIVIIKKPKNFESNNLIILINSTIKNLKLISDFLNMIQNYINNVSDENNKNNLHCNNFEISILNRKNRILLEYNKHCEQMKELIEYFLGCSNSITSQLEKQEIFKFFINT